MSKIQHHYYGDKIRFKETHKKRMEFTPTIKEFLQDQLLPNTLKNNKHSFGTGMKRKSISKN